MFAFEKVCLVIYIKFPLDFGNSTKSDNLKSLIYRLKLPQRTTTCRVVFIFMHASIVL